MTVECTLCPGRVCTQISWGRKIDDNKPGEVNPEKIKATTVSIDECEIREVLNTDDERLLVGS